MVLIPCSKKQILSPFRDVQSKVLKPDQTQWEDIKTALKDVPEKLSNLETLVNLWEKVEQHKQRLDEAKEFFKDRPDFEVTPGETASQVITSGDAAYQKLRYLETKKSSENEILKDAVFKLESAMEQEKYSQEMENLENRCHRAKWVIGEHMDILRDFIDDDYGFAKATENANKASRDKNKKNLENATNDLEKTLKLLNEKKARFSEVKDTNRKLTSLNQWFDSNSNNLNESTRTKFTVDIDAARNVRKNFLSTDNSEERQRNKQQFEDIVRDLQILKDQQVESTQSSYNNNDVYDSEAELDI